VCIYMYAYTYIHIYILICMYIFVFTHMCTFIFDVCICIYTHTCKYLCTAINVSSLLFPWKQIPPFLIGTIPKFSFFSIFIIFIFLFLIVNSSSLYQHSVFVPCFSQFLIMFCECLDNILMVVIIAAANYHYCFHHLLYIQSSS